MVGLLEAGEVERTWDIESRCGIRGWRRLMGMKRSSVISWGSVLVSINCQPRILQVHNNLWHTEMAAIPSVVLQLS